MKASRVIWLAGSDLPHTQGLSSETPCRCRHWRPVAERRRGYVPTTQPGARGLISVSQCSVCPSSRICRSRFRLKSVVMLSSTMLRMCFLSLASLASTLAVQTIGPGAALEARQSQTVPAPTTTPAPTGVITTTKYITIDGQTDSHVTIPGQTIAIAIPTCVQTITPDANGYVPPGTCGAIWNYYPSFRAAVAFAALFAVLVTVHIWQAVAYKKVRTYSICPPGKNDSLITRRGGAGSSSWQPFGK